MPEDHEFCTMHSGNDERIKALEEKINSRLNLMIGLLSALISIILVSVGWAYGTMGNQDKAIVRLAYIQESVVKRLDKLETWCEVHQRESVTTR